MEPDPARQNRIAYDQIAGRFVERNGEMLPYVAVAAGRLRDRLIAAGQAGLPVLDLGCGAGRDMNWLEARGAQMIGGDLSFGMLAEAKKRVRGGLCQLDMRFLPFPSAVFAATWCQAALLHLPKAVAPAALAEIHRVLLPGGLLHISVQKGESEGFETRPYEPVARYYAHYQPRELTSLIQTSGFELMLLEEAQSRRPWISILARSA